MFGLRYHVNGHEVRLLQISGGGRLYLESDGRKWWTKPPIYVAWQAYETDSGQTYPSRDEAVAVAKNLAYPNAAVLGIGNRDKGA